MQCWPDMSMVAVWNQRCFVMFAGAWVACHRTQAIHWPAWLGFAWLRSIKLIPRHNSPYEKFNKNIINCGYNLYVFADCKSLQSLTCTDRSDPPAGKAPPQRAPVNVRW